MKEELLKKISYDEIMKFKENIKALSLKKLKKIDLNFTDDFTENNLLAYCMEDKDLPLLIKLLECGLSPNHNNRHGNNMGFELITADSKLKRLQLYVKYGLDLTLKNNSGQNILSYMNGSHESQQYYDIIELTKIQVYLLSKDINLMFNEYAEHFSSEIKSLSGLTPLTLKYLQRYKGYNNLLENEFNNRCPLLFVALDDFSNLWNSGSSQSYGVKLFLDMLDMCENINIVNSRNENALFYLTKVNGLSPDYLDNHKLVVKKLIKKGIDVNRKNNNGMQILDYQIPLPLVETLLENGSKLSKEVAYKVRNEKKEIAMNDLQWNNKYYDIMSEQAIIQIAEYEKEEINKIINCNDLNKKIRNRL